MRMIAIVHDTRVMFLEGAAESGCTKKPKNKREIPDSRFMGIGYVEIPLDQNSKYCSKFGISKATTNS